MRSRIRCVETHFHIPFILFNITQGIETLKCDILFNKSNWLAQMIVHTGEKREILPFHVNSPKDCTCQFILELNQPDKSSLRAHARIHTRDKPFRCDICDATFSRKTQLRSHMRVHTGEKPYVCKICGTSFSHNGTLTKHMRIHTGD